MKSVFGKLLPVIAAFIATIGCAFAQVDVNSADQAALDAVKGVGAAMSREILDERKKGGNFKDWNDLEARVNGIGAKQSVKLSQAGLLVNGQPKPKTPSSAKEGSRQDKKIEKASANASAMAAADK